MTILSTLLDFNLLYFTVLILSCLFLFSVVDIYYDKKKNLWHLNGPFPLPLFGMISLLSPVLSYQSLYAIPSLVLVNLSR